MSARSVLVATVLAASGAAIVLAARDTAANAPAGRYTIGTGVAIGTVFDTKTKLTWQRSVASTKYTWADAKTTCASLVLNGKGWRLPTIVELSSLIDFSQSTGPYIDTTAFPGTPSGAFWSSTRYADTSLTSAWPVYFDLGASNASDRGSMFSIRCVR